MKSSAYIIKNNEIVASVTTDLKNGADVQFAYCTIADDFNANRKQSLVNARWGKISRAKKWFKEEARHVQMIDFAVEINPEEFAI